ncbi:MAG: bifunctional phosphopantothenoylcysteine decarboxylase/phosphopantothenate--cysteine ligase CoaBC [Candidatus Methanomethylicia archaeon]
MLHPSKDIISSKSNLLKGKRIVLCVCGSVSAIKAPDIARELMRHGADVYPVMSKAASKIIHPYLLEWATGNQTITELTGRIEHVEFCGLTESKVDLVLVCPATANTISKSAYGIDDTPVTTFISTAIGSNIPVVFVPAMHESLYRNPFVTENINRLKNNGVIFIGPKVYEGKAKIADIEDIIEAVISFFTPKILTNKRVIVTAGPTREYLDDVKYLSTPSSGKMGVEIAKECAASGASVTLVCGPINVHVPTGITIISVSSCIEMFKAVESSLRNNSYDYAFLAAAPVDFTFHKKHSGKIPSELEEVTVKLVQNPKISAEIKKISPKTITIGFKAEYGTSLDELINRAYKRLIENNLDLIVANDVSRSDIAFGSDYNEVYVIDRSKNVIHIPKSSKREVARRIIEVAVSVKC